MNVIVYSKPNCQPCKATKRNLDKYEIPFRELSLNDLPEKIEYMKSKGFKSAPFVEVYLNGELHNEWAGYKPDSIKGIMK